MSDQSTRGRQPGAVNQRLWGENSRINGNDGYNSLPVRISGSLTAEQMCAYQTMFRIQEITSTLRSNDLNPPERNNRSPSPAPAYDARGKRINTREQLYRRKLEEERHRLVEIALKMIPHFVAPEDYKRPVKFQDKYYIPVDTYPGINFVGLLLGPRGNTLRKLQETSGCKIAIRGRGSVKEGKNANDLPRGAMNFSDPLHCLIIADTEDKIQKGIKVCENIVVKAVTSPEGQNDLKRGQLRELAELNGTLREDNRPCPICGLQGHKKYECPNMETFAHKVICMKCGQHGHATIDCRTPIQGQSVQESRYSRYGGDGNAVYAQSWRENLPHSDYQQSAVTSYRSRQSRDSYNSTPDMQDNRPMQPGISRNITQAIPQGGSQSVLSNATFTQGTGQSREEPERRLTSPPGLDSSMAALSGSAWGMPGIPGMSSQTGIEPGTVPSTGKLPPGMDATPAIGFPGDETSLLPPGLGGPPGLSAPDETSQESKSLDGPPGL